MNDTSLISMTAGALLGLAGLCVLTMRGRGKADRTAALPDEAASPWQPPRQAPPGSPGTGTVVPGGTAKHGLSMRWSEHLIDVPGTPRTVRASTGADGTLVLAVAVADASRRVGQSVHTFLLGREGATSPLGVAGAAWLDLTVTAEQPAVILAFDPGPPLESAGVKAMQWTGEAWATAVIDGTRAMSRRSGMSSARSGPVSWAAYVEDQSLLWIARYESGEWRSFPIGRRGRIGEQACIVALSERKAVVVSQRLDAEWTSGDTVIGSFQTMDMHAGLKDDLRAAMSASSKDIVITTVDANGAWEDQVLTTVDNAHTPALGLDGSGRVLCATLHADDPPDFTRFRIRLWTRTTEGWSKEEVASFAEDAPFHLKILRDPAGSMFGGESFLLALKAKLDTSPVRIQPVLLWREGRKWLRQELESVDFDDEQCAHYHPVADAVVCGGRVHVFVPTMRQNRQGGVRWFVVEH